MTRTAHRITTPDISHRHHFSPPHIISSAIPPWRVTLRRDQDRPPHYDAGHFPLASPFTNPSNPPHPQISLTDADSRNRSLLTTERTDYTVSKPPHSVHSVHSVVNDAIENPLTTNDDVRRLNLNPPDRKSAKIRALCGSLSLVCLGLPSNPVTTKRAPPVRRRCQS